MKDFIELAKDAAATLAEEYAGQPQLEFLAWVTIALQREAMVSQAYDAAFVTRHLERWRVDRAIPTESIKAIELALAAVWTQESAHQRYFEAFIEAVSPPTTLLSWIGTRIAHVRGKVEGRVIAGIISPDARQRCTAQLAILVGSEFTPIPDYVQSLRQATFSEFCAINRDLEQTAVLGYGRMIALGRMMPDSDLVANTAVMMDLKRTEKDERYHEGLFRRLSQWPPTPGPTTGGSSGIGAATATPAGVTLQDARRLIGMAKAEAYGPGAEAIAALTVDTDMNRISRDPFVAYMRRFTRSQNAEAQGAEA